MDAETRTKAAHLVTYISDDSTIAAYLRVPRDEVAALRKNPGRTRRPATDSSDSRIFTPKTECKSASSGNQEGKRLKGGVVSDAQKALHERLSAIGWPVSIVRSQDEAHAALSAAGAPCVGRMT